MLAQLAPIRFGTLNPKPAVALRDVTQGLAFSSDQTQKIYVQDRIREQGAELWRWLQDGAQLYICGDASRMAKDVDQALRDVAQSHGGLGVEGAETYWRQLSEQKRYLRDVY